ncbi:MAG TPA: hypothetical protein VF801_01130 [Rhodocyclaceae bacterium]
MKAPTQMKIICVDVTNKCDLACSNCTRLLENQDDYWEMTPDNFRTALRSLKGYGGIIAMIGGNPCMHRNFEELCRVFVEEFPNKAQRGLWTNNLFKFEPLAIETFGVFNLNPHNVERGVKSLEGIKHLGWYYGGNSEHSSLLTAVKDFYEPPQMWEKISRCDINQEWSASIVQRDGKLKAYFCEVAASFDLARKGDFGFEVFPGWWQAPIQHFTSQIAHFCPGCGVPARIAPVMDFEETDTYSKSNADLATKAATGKKKRKVIEITTLEQAKRTDHTVVQYSPNIYKRPKIAVVTPYYKEPVAMLRQCHESVIGQDVEADVIHYMIGDGVECEAIRGWDAVHLVLPKGHADNGNTPRAIGCVLAESAEVDFIAYLDADNWFRENHLSSLLKLHQQTGAPVCCSWRTFHTMDGTEMPISEGDENSNQHVDTSCFLISRDAFGINSVWYRMPKALSPCCDRIFYSALKNEKLPMVHSCLRTVAFRTQYASHFIDAGWPVPEGVKGNTLAAPYTFLMTRKGIKECIDKLGFWPVFGN